MKNTKKTSQKTQKSPEAERATSLYDDLDRIEDQILSARDEVDGNYGELVQGIYEALEAALEQVQVAMRISDPIRFGRR